MQGQTDFMGRRCNFSVPARNHWSSLGFGRVSSAISSASYQRPDFTNTREYPNPGSKYVHHIQDADSNHPVDIVLTNTVVYLWVFVSLSRLASVAGNVPQSRCECRVHSDRALRIEEWAAWI